MTSYKAACTRNLHDVFMALSRERRAHHGVSEDPLKSQRAELIKALESFIDQRDIYTAADQLEPCTHCGLMFYTLRVEGCPNCKV